MKHQLFVGALGVWLCGAAVVSAQVATAGLRSDAVESVHEEVRGSSSTEADRDGDAAELRDAPAAASGVALARPVARPRGMGPFSTVGIDMKSGIGGYGMDIATPLGRHFNLRAGGSYMNFDLGKLNLVEGGLAIAGTVQLRTVNTCIDYYPMGDSFRISPGVTLYNGNNFSGTGRVPPGGSITLNGTDYTSSPTDPLVASFNTPSGRFGHKIAPSLTMGVGSILPRGEGKHWSIPVELGIEYIAPPKLVLGLTGTACSSSGCGNVATDAETQQNLQAQQTILNQDIYNLRFFPIFSIGMGYKF